ncbi:MAG: hypothetical protein K2M69_06760 [Muribaculaceae bacterium]|nr:hypothetical protein [Muribaculaceae bacterium]
MKSFGSQKLIGFFLAFMISGWVCAQNLGSLLNDFDYKARIGLVDEFFERFNGKAVNPVLDKPDRLKSLVALFDQSQFSSYNDPRFKEAIAMAERIINDSVLISYPDSMWIALAHCTAVLDGKNVKLDLFLNVEKRGEDMYKWVISKAAGDIFSISPKYQNDKNMLYPDDHETNFMSLARLCKEQPSDIMNFMNKSFKYDPTNVFVYLIYNGKLKIEYVEQLEFVFTQVPGYMFNIRYFDREGFNSGWLISNFYEFTDEDKRAFLIYAGNYNRIEDKEVKQAEEKEKEE